MATENRSAGSSEASDSAREYRKVEVIPLISSALPVRNGQISLSSLIDLYLRNHSGQDSSRLQRLTWWALRLGETSLEDLSDDDVHAALEHLASQEAKYYMGRDADGQKIFKSKKRPISAATVNRYSAALSAVITWAMKKRIAPKGYVHPCKTVDRKSEPNEKTRFLSDDERQRLLAACRQSKWPKLYLLVLMALTTGARKGELVRLRWQDTDIERGLAFCARTKNGDAKTLPLLPAVVAELSKFKGSTNDLIFPSKALVHKAFNFESRWREARIRDFRFHDLRHTCASMLAQNGATLLEIGDVLGHRQLQVTKRYSHLTTTHKAALLNKVLGQIT